MVVLGFVRAFGKGFHFIDAIIVVHQKSAKAGVDAFIDNQRPLAFIADTFSDDFGTTRKYIFWKKKNTISFHLEFLHQGQFRYYVIVTNKSAMIIKKIGLKVIHDLV